MRYSSSTGPGTRRQRRTRTLTAHTDGFQLSYTVQALADQFWCYLALYGTFTSTIGNGVAPTTAITQNLALASGTPKGALLCTHQNVVSSTQQTTGTSLGGFGVGGMDGTNEGYAGIVQEDVNTAAICGRRFSTTKMIETLDAVAAAVPTVRGSADSSISGSNVVLDWTADPDTIACEYGWVILGEPAAAAGMPPLVMARHG